MAQPAPDRITPNVTPPSEEDREVVRLLIELVGVRRLIQALGPTQVIQAAIQVFGVSGVLAALTPEQWRELLQPLRGEGTPPWRGQN
jgi:hypothetical protein